MDQDNYDKRAKGPPPDGYIEDTHLLLSGDLTDWERGFLESVRTQHFWSLKQQDFYLKIRDKYLSRSGAP